MKGLILIATALAMCTVNPLQAQEDARDKAAKYEAAAKVIDVTLDVICGAYSRSGSQWTADVETKADGALSGLFKFISDIGLSIKVSAKRSEYKDLLREDLPKDLKDIRLCRTTHAGPMLEDLLDVRTGEQAGAWQMHAGGGRSFSIFNKAAFTKKDITSYVKNPSQCKVRYFRIAYDRGEEPLIAYGPGDPEKQWKETIHPGQTKLLARRCYLILERQMNDHEARGSFQELFVP